MILNKQAIIKIVVNNPTAAPVTEGNVAKSKEYMLQTKELLNQVKNIKQQTEQSANSAAESANNAAESASSAFASAAKLWQDSKTYNPPDVVAGSDGNTYRCIITNNNVNPINDNGIHWKKITYNTNGIISLDKENNICPYADTTGTIVPNDLGGNLGNNNKRWNAIYSKKIISQSMEINGQDIETLSNGGRTILKRNTTYNKGDIVYSAYFPSWMYIECLQTGVTGDQRPDNLYITTEIGATVDDGSSKWITRHIHDGHVKGEVFTLSGATFNGEGFLIHPVLNIVVKDVHICDGTNETPDLRGKFIIGANDTTYKENATGGEETHKLTVEELPPHKPNISMVSAGGHNHKYSAICKPFKSRFATREDSTPNKIFYDENTTSWNGEHTHPLTVGNVGGDKPHNNMPPYYALVYVKKIK